MSLKEKQKTFAQLKNEGLINKDRHLKMEQELKKAIKDLETILDQLEA